MVEILALYSKRSLDRLSPPFLSEICQVNIAVIINVHILEVPGSNPGQITRYSGGLFLLLFSLSTRIPGQNLQVRNLETYTGRKFVILSVGMIISETLLGLEGGTNMYKFWDSDQLENRTDGRILTPGSELLGGG
jgi:hypothetical protein